MLFLLYSILSLSNASAKIRNNIKPTKYFALMRKYAEARNRLMGGKTTVTTILL
jgi:hypothetical protein